MNTMKSIHFNCPKCGGHELMMMESALRRKVILSMKIDKKGKLTIIRKEWVDDLSGEVQGYRCRHCRYPDCGSEINVDHPDAFHWKTLEDVLCAGGISWEDGAETMEHRGMICFPDGSMTAVVVVVAHPGLPTSEERRLVLERAGVTDGILIFQGDVGIRSLACPNWKRVKRHVLQLTINDM